MAQADGQPVLYDLFCKAGGATRGYQRAGFYVIGVDIEPQPNYCGDAFVQADAMTFPLDGCDAVHASPPCQGYLNEHFRVTPSGHVRKDHPRLIGPVRERFIAHGVPWVIENVASARSEMRDPITLCGSSFGLAVRRHRLFEFATPPALVPPCAHHLQQEAKYPTQFRPKNGQNPLARVVQVYGNGKGASEWPAAMGIDWPMTRKELANAIPPTYTEWIGRQLLDEIERGLAHVNA